MVQRRNNRLRSFLDDEDRQRYLQCLRQALLRFGCRLHAYVLMSNHVHLLLTPDEAGSVSRLMHTFARNYVGTFNERHGRTGTLWEGRYKACMVDWRRYFLACSRNVELNPETGAEEAKRRLERYPQYLQASLAWHERSRLLKHPCVPSYGRVQHRRQETAQVRASRFSRSRDFLRPIFNF